LEKEEPPLAKSEPSGTDKDFSKASNSKIGQSASTQFDSRRILSELGIETIVDQSSSSKLLAQVNNHLFLFAVKKAFQKFTFCSHCPREFFLFPIILFVQIVQFIESDERWLCPIYILNIIF
jgi:hypothetical protein